MKKSIKKLSKKVSRLLIASMVITMGVLGVLEVNASAGAQDPLYRYCDKVTNLHFYTTDFSELGNGKGNYIFERVEGYVSGEKYNGTIPLYRYCRRTDNAHFYTTDWNELKSGNNEYIYEGIQCYVSPRSTVGQPGYYTRPLYRYCRMSDNAHFYTTDWNELKGGNSEYLYERIECGIL